MRFLIIGRVRPGTPINILSKLSLAQMEYLARLKEEGRIEVYYHLTGQQGTVVICDVASEEELSRLMSRDPLFFHMEREIHPLITFESHRKLIKELLSTP